MRTFSFVLFAFCLVAFSTVSSDDDESDDWIMVQSPIALSLNRAKKRNFKPMQFHGHWKMDGEAVLENRGKNAKITFQNRKMQPYISGGPLTDNTHYIFEEMHFHWDKKNKFGSEHTINGKSYSMEAHLVHFNEEYGNLKTATNYKDGVAVIAIPLMARGNLPNKNFAKITNHIPKVREPGAKYMIAADSLHWTSSRNHNKGYFTYRGSLTTTPFAECVTWIVYDTPVYISKQQVEVFRQLLSFNHTSIQKNRRQVIKNKMRPEVFYAPR